MIIQSTSEEVVSRCTWHPHCDVRAIALCIDDDPLGGYTAAPAQALYNCTRAAPCAARETQLFERIVLIWLKKIYLIWLI